MRATHNRDLGEYAVDGHGKISNLPICARTWFAPALRKAVGGASTFDENYPREVAQFSLELNRAGVKRGGLWRRPVQGLCAAGHEAGVDAGVKGGKTRPTLDGKGEQVEVGEICGCW